MAATPAQFVRINYRNAALQKFTTRGLIKKSNEKGKYACID
jgi:hypothetical protein